MTDPSRRPSRRARARTSDPVGAPGAAASSPSAAPRPRLGVWPVATGVLAVLGVAALTAAVLVPTGVRGSATGGTGAATTAGATPGTTTGRTTSASPTAPAPGTGATSTATAADVQDTPVAELADPDWVARIAAAGDIPERALAAYAGAALAVADSHPGCGLGWNTLAAIGLVESEHGTLGGATLDDDGTVSPSIIGVALDGGDGVAAVSDTDGGTLDGDPVWDHAVGPMQFVPATWAQTAQDGDRDGETDVNQIDDAVLSAAVHLCEVGGDLSVAEGWIAAIAAYNDSVEYNNRVAEAAEHYATLT
ncbi:MAG TPA: lytic murein transglycosylase [Cellulomonas sp.]